MRWGLRTKDSVYSPILHQAIFFQFGICAPRAHQGFFKFYFNSQDVLAACLQLFTYWNRNPIISWNLFSVACFWKNCRLFLPLVRAAQFFLVRPWWGTLIILGARLVRTPKNPWCGPLKMATNCWCASPNPWCGPPKIVGARLIFLGAQIFFAHQRTKKKTLRDSPETSKGFLNNAKNKVRWT